MNEAADANFLRTTGFESVGPTPTMDQAAGTPPPASSRVPGALAIPDMYKSNSMSAQQPPRAPGQAQARPMNGQLPGILPGGLPVDLQANPRLGGQQKSAYDDSMLLGNPGARARGAQVPDGKQRSWDAVGVGPRSNPQVGGQRAIVGPNHGRATPPFTGKNSVIPVPGAANQFGGLGPMMEQMGGALDFASMDSRTLLLSFASVAVGIAIMAALSRHQQWQTAPAAAAGLAGGVGFRFAADAAWQKAESMRGTSGQYGAPGEKLQGSPHYSGDVTGNRMDLNAGRKNFYPRNAQQGDGNPFPRAPDQMTDTRTRLGDRDDLHSTEGPRGDYWYRRAETKDMAERDLQPKDLMRDPKQYNLNQSDYDEYMARLSGLAPDQFYQAQPYMANAPYWENRQRIDDSETQHAISTAPGTFNRKWNYKDSRINQAGAKLMHLKDPPPGSGGPFGTKTHPWMEPKDGVHGAPFNVDDLSSEQMGGLLEPFGGTGVSPGLAGHSEHPPPPPPESGLIDPHAAVSVNDIKVTSADAGRMLNDRTQEENMFRSIHGPPPTEDGKLPPGLEPVATSKDGIAKALQARQKQTLSSEESQTKEMMDYMRGQQGYGGAALPPHPQSLVGAKPNDYGELPEPPFPMHYPAPNQMPTPQMIPKAAAVEETAESKAQNAFASAFETEELSKEVIDEELRNAKSNKR